MFLVWMQGYSGGFRPFGMHIDANGAQVHAFSFVRASDAARICTARSIASVMRLACSRFHLNPLLAIRVMSAIAQTKKPPTSLGRE